MGLYAKQANAAGQLRAKHIHSYRKSYGRHVPYKRRDSDLKWGSRSGSMRSTCQSLCVRPSKATKRRQSHQRSGGYRMHSTDSRSSLAQKSCQNLTEVCRVGHVRPPRYATAAQQRATVRQSTAIPLKITHLGSFHLRTDQICALISRRRKDRHASSCGNDFRCCIVIKKFQMRNTCLTLSPPPV